MHKVLKGFRFALVKPLKDLLGNEWFKPVFVSPPPGTPALHLFCLSLLQAKLSVVSVMNVLLVKSGVLS